MFKCKFYLKSYLEFGYKSFTLYIYNWKHAEMGRIDAAIRKDNVEIDTFAIKKRYRGKGYGRKLFEEFERRIENHNQLKECHIISRIIVYPHPYEAYEEKNYIPVPLDELIKIYEALGFKENEKYRDTALRQMIKEM